MQNELNFWHYAIKKHWEALLLWVGLALIIALGIALVQQFRYGATVRLLIIQRSSLTLDPFNALKASERISDSLSQVIYTSTFLDRVMQTNYPIDRTVFSQDERLKRREWNKMVSAEVVRGTGLMSVTAYHKDRDQAKLYALATAEVLINQGPDYIGGGDVQVRLVDSPLVSNFPMKPNIFMYVFLAVTLGLVAGLLYLGWTMPRTSN